MKVSDLRCQQYFKASQSIEVEFEFDGVALNDTNGYALVLRTGLVSVSNDGQRHFDIV